MKKGSISTKEVLWDSGPGVFPYFIRGRLLEDNKSLILEISRRGKALAPVFIPPCNPLDYPLVVTAILAEKCPELSVDELNDQERELRHLLRAFAAPRVTVSFGPKRKAHKSQLLHFANDEFFSARRLDTVILLQGHSEGDDLVPPFLRNWVCWITTVSIAEAERLLGKFAKSKAKAKNLVVEYNNAVIGIRAANANTWISAGFTEEMMHKFAHAEGFRLQRLPAPDEPSLTFRAGRKPSAG